MAISLRTPRLLLREWRASDLEPFTAISADPEVMAMLPPLPNRASCEAWIERMRAHGDEHGFSYWAVDLPGQTDLIGAIGLSCVRTLPFAPAVEIGWRLARRYWGKGYATEAARAAIEDGFFRLGLEEIVAFTVLANRRSWRIMEQLGMSRDPNYDFDHPHFPKQHPLRRHILYRLRRDSLV